MAEPADLIGAGIMVKLRCLSSNNPRAFLRGRLKTTVIVVLGMSVAVWVALDLFRPRANDLREFDPDEIARRETAFWRSYYGERRLRLMFQLSAALQTQYGLSFFRSNLAAARAAHAAFIFKKGGSRREYELALPRLKDAFSLISAANAVPFDPDRAARLELEWWMLRRDGGVSSEELAVALAEAAAEVYRVAPEYMEDYGRLRAQAMRERSRRARERELSQDDWDAVESLLILAYRSIWEAVRSPTAEIRDY